MKEVNEKFSKNIIEIGIDGVYSRMMLRQKKKYAGKAVSNFMQVLNSEATPILKTEVKGLELKNANFADISKEIGTEILEMILSHKEITLEEVYTYLETIGNRVKEAAINNKPMFFLKQKINKKLSEYNPKKAPSFFKVAKRVMLRKGLSEEQFKNSTISFLICKNDQETLISNKAFTLEELEESQNT